MSFTLSFSGATDPITNLINSLISVWNALLNVFLAPFKALADIFNGWSEQALSQWGAYAPIYAIVIISLIYFIIKFSKKVNRKLGGLF